MNMWKTLQGALKKHYEVNKGLKQHICRPKPYVQNGIHGTSESTHFCGHSNIVPCLANFIWLSYLLLKWFLYEDTKGKKNISSGEYNFQMILFHFRYIQTQIILFNFRYIQTSLHKNIWGEVLKTSSIVNILLHPKFSTLRCD